MSHETLTINNWLFNELFDYLLLVLCIEYYPRIPIPTLAKAAPLGDASAQDFKRLFVE